MITNPKVLEYLDIISPVNSKAIEEIRAEAKRNYIPIIKRDTENFLKFILKMQYLIQCIIIILKHSAVIMVVIFLK